MSSEDKQLLLEEIEALKSRLEEAEETLRAIRSGEVDALIVSGPIGEQIYTLQGAETPYRILIEDMQEGALSLASDGTILYGNLHFAQMMEVPHSRIVGTSLFDYCEHDLEKLKELIEVGSVTSVKEEIYLGPVNGKLVPTYISASPILDEYSRRVGIVITDLTAQKQHEEIVATEKALRESEKRLREIADAMPQIVWTAGSDGRIDYFNKRWTGFSGLEQADESAWERIMHPEDFSRHSELWQRAVAGDGPYDIECRLKDVKSGCYSWHLCRALPVRDKDGAILRWYGTCTDINSQKEAEEDRERLVTNERTARNIAESANRMKDNFLATLSHELRTPLNAILGYTQLMRKKGVGNGSFMENGLSVIERNARIQSDLISDLLDMSRIVSGKVSLELETIDLGLLINEIANSMQPGVDAKALNFHVDLESGIDDLMGDAIRIRQIIWNLVSNAIKFTPRGGRVGISAKRKTDRIEIEVKDSGQGISPDFLPHVFDTFRQADATTSRKFGGLGLGLSIVRHLTELHGGSVEAESSGENLGTTFRIKLPINADILPTMHKKEKFSLNGSSCSLKGIRVLVVDDEPDARNLVELVLKEREAQVVTAGSAREALQCLKDGKHDILISDVGMPEQDGYELISKVRSLSAAEGGLIPAIALTAFARTEDRRKALISGFQIHLSKPIEPEELASVVANLSSHLKTSEVAVKL